MNAVLKAAAAINKEVECMLLKQIQLGYLRYLRLLAAGDCKTSTMHNAQCNNELAVAHAVR